MEQKIIVTCPRKFSKIFKNAVVTHEDFNYMFDAGLFYTPGIKQGFARITSLDMFKTIWRKKILPNYDASSYGISPHVLQDAQDSQSIIRRCLNMASKGGSDNLIIELFQQIPDLPLELFFKHVPPMKCVLLTNYCREDNSQDWHPLFFENMKKAGYNGFPLDWELYYQHMPNLALKDFKQYFQEWVNQNTEYTKDMIEMLSRVNNKQIPLLYWYLKQPRRLNDPSIFDEWLSKLQGKNKAVAAQCALLEGLFGGSETISKHNWLKYFNDTKKGVAIEPHEIPLL